MVQEGYFSNWKRIKNISYGLVAVLFLSWLVFNTFAYVPKAQESFWFKVFISYSVFGAAFFANADVRNKLFNVRLLDFLPRFILFFFASVFIFWAVLSFIDPLSKSSFGVLAGLPWWLAGIHAFVFATYESVIWQGGLDEMIGRPASALVAGFFHWFVWTGGALIVIPSATLLFAFFSICHLYFRKNKNDLAPVIGIHTAFNFVKLALLVAVGGSL